MVTNQNLKVFSPAMIQIFKSNRTTFPIDFLNHVSLGEIVIKFLMSKFFIPKKLKKLKKRMKKWLEKLSKND